MLFDESAPAPSRAAASLRRPRLSTWRFHQIEKVILRGKVFNREELSAQHTGL